MRERVRKSAGVPIVRASLILCQVVPFESHGVVLAQSSLTAVGDDIENYGCDEAEGADDGECEESLECPTDGDAC